MTFRDYIGCIAKFIIGSQANIITDLFKEAGAIKPVEEDTAKSWLRRERSNRQCRIRDYFLNDKLDEKYFIKFLKDRVNTSWEKLQETFRSINDDKIVDIYTVNQGDFYWSLLNQFQKIHGLPLSEKPTSSIGDDYPNLQDSFSHKEMIRIFKEIAECYHVADFINRNPSMIYFKNLNMNYDLLSLVTRFIDEIQSEIIAPFDPYKGDRIYIKISQFITIIVKYKEYLTRKVPYDALVMIPFLESELEVETEHFCAKLKSIFNEICNIDVN